MIERRRASRHRIAVLLAGASLALACAGDGDGDDVATERATTSSTFSTSAPSSTSPDDTTATSGATTQPPATAPGSTGSPSTTTATTAGSGTAPGSSSTTTPPGTTPPAGRLADLDLAVARVGSAEVPTAYRVHASGAYVAEQAGRVRNLASGAVALDIRDRVRSGGEQGLLGLAFDGSGTRMYVHYSDDADGGAGVVDEYAFAGGRADPGSRRELLRVAQPFANHNGGDIHVGPDGMLWIALGDGGSAGDPRENGQDPGTLLGSILRIDPANPSGGRAYGIPAGNPFAPGSPGAGGGAPEVWLYGVRNPWRISFDPANGDLWVADVGQNAWEEITVLPAASGRGRGANLGWNQLEGTHAYDGPAPAGAVGPVFEYPHDEGCSITGGFVYRGDAIPGLRGAYVFGDLCRASIRAIRPGPGGVDAATWDVGIGAPISFGVEASGELVVLTQGGGVLRVVRA